MIKPKPQEELEIDRKDIIIAIGGAGANILKTVYDKTDETFHQKTRFTIADYDPEKLSEFKDENFELYWLDKNNPEDHDISLFIGTEKTILIAGLGGNTADYLLPYTIEVAKDFGKVDVKAIVTLPFKIEGEKRREEALTTLETLKEKLGEDNVIVFDNEKLLKENKELTFFDAFKFIDKQIIDSIKDAI